MRRYIQQKSHQELEKKTPFFHKARIQPKLTIGRSGDKYEQEADRMANYVVNRSNGSTNSRGGTGGPDLQAKCATCEKDDKSVLPKLQKMDMTEEEDMGQAQPDISRMEEEEDEIAGQGGTIQQKNEKRDYPEGFVDDEDQMYQSPIQLKSNKNSSMVASSGLQSQLNSSKGGGRPLSGVTLQEMGTSFGADFHGVRVHTDTRAVQMNKELGAQAFTHGKDVYFNAGKYQPESSEGKRLLAHELTHVVQQGGITEEKLRRKGKKNPGLGADKKNYSYGKVKGDLYVDDTGKKVPTSDKTGKGVSLNDVKQGALGDCYFMAAIGAIAKSDPASLKELITENADGTYTVKLYVEKSWWTGKRSPKNITVTPSFPLTKSGKPAYAGKGDKNELWVMLIEKAYAQYRRGYHKIENGNPGEAMEILTGKTHITYKTKSLSEKRIIELLSTWVTNGYGVTASTQKFKGNKSKKELVKNSGLYTSHAYVVKSVDVGKQTISLYNPWGSSHPPAVSVKDFKKIFYRFQVINK